MGPHPPQALGQVLRGIDISLTKSRRTFSDVQIDGLADSWHGMDRKHGR